MEELRKAYLTGMADSPGCDVGAGDGGGGKGDAVPYARCVDAATAGQPEASQPEKKRERVAELVGRAGIQGRIAGGRGCVAARAGDAHGFGARSERGGDRTL